MSRPLFPALAALLASAAAVSAEVPRVVTDIPPVQSLAARVMAGLGEPALLVRPGASPHGYAMKPSEAAALQDAQVVFFVGPELTPWLEGPLGALAPEAAHVELLAAPGTTTLPTRTGATFPPHSHGPEEGSAEGHDHDHAAPAGGADHDHAAAPAAADHDHAAPAPAAEHDHDHDHDHAAPAANPEAATQTAHAHDDHDHAAPAQPAAPVADAHDHDHDHAAAPAAAEAAAEQKHAAPAGDDHDHDHAKAAPPAASPAAPDDHDHDHDHDHHHGDHAHSHDGIDPHAWLDPENGKAWLDAIAAELSRLDPSNAAAYAANAAAGKAEIDAAATDARGAVAGLEAVRMIVFHDAYQYFERRFGLEVAGAVSLSDASTPSPARIAELRDTVRTLGATCALSEPQFSPKLLDTVFDGVEVRRAVIDPIGADIAPGPGLYPALIRNMAAQMAVCR